MNEGDDLLRHIHGFVHGRVPPNLENIVTELVGRTVVLIMTTPDFYNHLKAIQELQLENWNLRQALISYQRSEQMRSQKARARKMSPKGPTTPTKRAAAKSVAKKAAPRKTKSLPSNVRAFKRGSSGR